MRNLVVPAYVRRALHASHALATLVLLATGLLLEFPELRSLSVGGYGHRIVNIHLVAGVVFASAPLVGLALAPAALLEDLRRRLGPPDPWRWRKSHIAGSVVTVAILSVSGVLLWLDARLPDTLVDGSRTAHAAFTVVIGVSLVVHLVMARRAMVSRVKGWLGRGESPDAFFDLDEE